MTRIKRPFVEPGHLPAADQIRPFFEFDRRLRSLESAFYRHLLAAIDLDLVFGLEQKLWTKIADRSRFTDDQVLDIANAVVTRAFERLGHDPRRAMQEGVTGADGRIAPAPEAPHEHCPFCEDDGPRGAGGAPRPLLPPGLGPGDARGHAHRRRRRRRRGALAGS